jgi:TonB-linked SusC/RagA family outer membrane protein
MKEFINKILILFVVISFSQNDFAQTAVDNFIRGKVFSKNDGALMAVNVCEIDNTNRIISNASTDFNGNFSLKIKNPANKLKVSYIGYTPQILSIGSKRLFNIELIDKTELAEVIVKSKKVVSTGNLDILQREVSTATQTISAKEFEGLSVASVDEALQGRIAGLDIVANSGDLGSGTSMRIRGITSINGNSEPLIILNGVIFSTPTTNFDFVNANNENFANLLSVNVDDIESITVLKDAASTAVWGSRGANGVISITMKKGVKGKTRVQYSYRYTGATQPKGLTMLNGDDYTMLMKEAYFNPTQSVGASNIREFNYDKSYSEYEQYNNNTDWIKAVSNYGVTNDHYIQLQGGGDRARFLVSGGYLNQTGTVIGQKLERFSSRMNLDYNVSDRIKFTSEFSFTYTNNDQNYEGLLGNAYKRMPNLSIYEQDAFGNNTDRFYKILPTASDQLDDQRKMFNPVASANLAKKNTKDIRVLPTFRIQYDFTNPQEQMLRYKGYIAFDVNNGSSSTFVPKELTITTWQSDNINKSYASSSRSVSITTDHNLTYCPKFDNVDHSLMLYGSFQMGSSTSRYQEISSYGNPSESITNPVAGGYVNSFKTGPGEGRWMAYMFMAHYAFKSKYIADITVRRDGSTKFGDSRKWGTFPGISFAWNLMDESFMKWSNKWLSTLKLRPSWGMTGNQPNNENMFNSTYTENGKYIDMPGIRPNNIRLTDLRWEKVTSYNGGIDFGFFEDRFTADFNYYYKRTNDMLFKDLDISSVSGFSKLTYQNGGTMDNQGWELNLNAAKLVKAGDFNIDVRLNFSNNYNTIIDLKKSILDSKNKDYGYGNGEYLSRIQLNNSYGSIYGFRSLGVYQYSDYVEGRAGTSPYAKDVNGHVIRDAQGLPLQMTFAYGKTNEYKFKGGDAIYEDINHDGNINELDIVYLGNSNPLVNGGFGMKFNYQRLSVNVNTNFRIGNKVVNMGRMNAENMYSNNNQCASVNWRWRKNGDVTTIPRALFNSGYNWLGSDRYVEDGSFWRIKNITVNYALPAKMLKKYSVTQFNLYLTINDLLTFTKYTGVDPEVGYGNLGVSTDNSQTPRSKSFTAGITVGF